MSMGVFIYVSKAIVGIIFFLHPVHMVSFIVGVCLSILECMGKRKTLHELGFQRQPKSHVQITISWLLTNFVHHSHQLVMHEHLLAYCG